MTCTDEQRMVCGSKLWFKIGRFDLPYATKISVSFGMARDALKNTRSLRMVKVQLFTQPGTRIVPCASLAILAAPPA